MQELAWDLSLDIASEILGRVLVYRLQAITGFRYFRGTIDGAFTVINALRMRQEHNQESYVTFIDLIKVLNSVPRATLWKVLLKFGLPWHFI